MLAGPRTSVFDKSNNYTSVNFIQFSDNAGYPTSFFNIDLEKGYDVIDLR